MLQSRRRREEAEAEQQPQQQQQQQQRRRRRERGTAGGNEGRASPEGRHRETLAFMARQRKQATLEKRRAEQEKLDNAENLRRALEVRQETRRGVLSEGESSNSSCTACPGGVEQLVQYVFYPLQWGLTLTTENWFSWPYTCFTLPFVRL